MPQNISFMPTLAGIFSFLLANILLAGVCAELMPNLLSVVSLCLCNKLIIHNEHMAFQAQGLISAGEKYSWHRFWAAYLHKTTFGICYTKQTPGLRAQSPYHISLPPSNFAENIHLGKIVKIMDEQLKLADCYVYFKEVI